jgi:hypothetical protein
VSAIPGINQEQVTAVSCLVSLLARLAVERLREDTLRELIGDGGPAAKTVVDGLSELVVPRLKSRLGAERTQLAGYFAKAILDQRDTVGPDAEALCVGSAASKFSSTGFLLTQEYCKRFTILDRRAEGA